jgi:hypothetical protein
MLVFLTFVLSSITSLRGAARAFETLTALLPMSLPLTPCSWWTGRLWLLRLGLHKLTRPKAKADDWVWIADHSVQVGPEKCLLILGIRLSSLRADTCHLTHEEMEPITLCPVRKSTGDIVYEQLEAAVEKTGVPREIVSDHGPDLQAGIRQFCAQHPATCAVYDITHKAASLVKAFLLYDDTWERFCRFATRMKQQVTLTDLAVLAPPAQRSKARYMNVSRLGRWAADLLTVLDEDRALTDTETLSSHPNAAKVTGLEEFREDIAVWNAVFDVVTMVEDAVRQYGLCALCVERLEEQIYAGAWLPHVSIFAEELLQFVRDESAKARPGERLLGSSEVIESVFGKLKALEKGQANQGFTGFVLSAAALVAPTTLGVVREAMETVSTHDAYTWCRDSLGPSVQAQRKTVFARPDSSEIEMGST